LKPEAVEVVKKFGDLQVVGTVSQDLHNSCWPEPPPFVMALHFGTLIVQRRNEVTLIYLLHNTVRHIPLNASHPENLTPSCQGHSVGWYEGDTLVIDTVGIKVAYGQEGAASRVHGGGPRRFHDAMVGTRDLSACDR
jgi:hypothetical protein